MKVWIHLLPGLLLTLVGLALALFPPKKINGFYGYRTRKSRSSQARWDFAQKYSAKLTVWCGVVCLAVGGGVGFALSRLGLSPQTATAYGAAIDAVLPGVAAVVVIGLTERALSRV